MFISFAISAALLLSAGSTTVLAAETKASASSSTKTKTATKPSSTKSVSKTKTAAAVGAAGLVGVTGIAAVDAVSQTPELDALNAQCAQQLASGSMPQAEETCVKAWTVAEKTAPTANPLAMALSNQAPLLSAKNMIP